MYKGVAICHKAIGLFFQTQSNVPLFVSFIEAQIGQLADFY